MRAEYEEIVSEIQSDEWLPVANELVKWPCPGGLCYPVFQAKETHAMAATSSPSVAPHLPLLDGPTSGQDSVAPGQGQASVKQDKEDEVDFVVIPRDKESLLELRRKLSMELVWLKQAIISRQQVC